MPTLSGNSSVESIDYMTEAFYKSDYRKLPIFPTLLEIELGVKTEHDCYLAYLKFVYESRKKRVKPC